MSYQEAKYAASFVATAGVTLIYWNRVRDLHETGYFDGPDGLALIGRAVLVLIGSLIIAGILAQIVLAILRGIFGAEIDMTEDERDRAIELRAMNAGFAIFGFGFVGAFIALALGQSVFAVLHYLVFSMILYGLVADVVRIWLHRCGF